jgi:transcriptional regulator with XRE-family HTH domain
MILFAPAPLYAPKKLTQADIAKLLKTTQQQYSKYEIGIQEIPAHHIVTLADFYTTSADYILGRANDPAPPKRK